MARKLHKLCHLAVAAAARQAREAPPETCPERSYRNVKATSIVLVPGRGRISVLIPFL